MKKTIKLLGLTLIFLLSITLISCNGSSNLPRPEGKKVYFSNTELERKLDNLNFDNQEEKIFEYVANVEYKVTDNDNKEGTTLEMTGVSNLKTEDFWLDLSFKYYDNDGLMDAKVKGFESQKYTYFDITHNTNKLFESEYLNQEIYNGKYKIEKEDSSWGSYQNNTLEDVLWDFNVHMEYYDFEFAEWSFPDELIYGLNKYEYNNLNFYEKDRLFTIELIITLKDLENARPEIFEVIIDEFGMVDDLDEIIEFNIRMVYVFDRNRLVDVGIDGSVGYRNAYFKDENRQEFYKTKYRIKYIDKTPAEIKYSEYELIADTDEILK